MTSVAGVPLLVAGYQLEESVADARHELDTFLAPYWDAGVPLWVNYSVRPSHVNMHFERSIMWSGVRLARAGQRPACRPARAWPTPRGATGHGRWDDCTYTSIRPARRTRRRARRPHPSTRADWFWPPTSPVTSARRTVPSTPPRRRRRRAIHAVGRSDAGAHVQMFRRCGRRHVPARAPRTRGRCALGRGGGARAHGQADPVLRHPRSGRRGTGRRGRGLVGVRSWTSSRLATRSRAPTSPATRGATAALPDG